MQEDLKDANDQAVLDHIANLVAEQRRLHNHGTNAEDDSAQLANIRVELDQCWDLLRQRRALREFGRDPKEAHVRPLELVEHYEG